MTQTTDYDETITCSFCGKSADEVKKLVAGPNVYICDECVALAKNIIDQELSADKAAQVLSLTTPHDLVAKLNDYEIGQDEEK